MLDATADADRFAGTVGAVVSGVTVFTVTVALAVAEPAELVAVIASLVRPLN